MCRLDDPLDVDWAIPEVRRVGYALILAALIVVAVILVWTMS